MFAIKKIIELISLHLCVQSINSHFKPCSNLYNIKNIKKQQHLFKVYNAFKVTTGTNNRNS